MWLTFWEKRSLPTWSIPHPPPDRNDLCFFSADESFEESEFSEILETKIWQRHLTGKRFISVSSKINHQSLLKNSSSHPTISHGLVTLKIKLVPALDGSSRSVANTSLIAKQESLLQKIKSCLVMFVFWEFFKTRTSDFEKSVV